MHNSPFIHNTVNKKVTFFPVVVASALVILHFIAETISLQKSFHFML